jgi:hypothetical protein
MYYNISIKFYDYLASFLKGGFQRVKIVIKRGGDFEMILEK